jgi:uncharacterized protein (TIGR01777 family)
MRVAVTGSTGFIGEAVVAELAAAGHEPVRVVRHNVPDHLSAIRWDPARGEIDSTGFADVDAVIHLAGEPIAARRWSQQQKAKIHDSRVLGTALVAETMASLERPRVLVSASAIGYYGDRADEVLTEDSAAGTGFLSDVCEDWEQATAPAEKAGARVVHARNGIVLSADGGSLAEQLPFFRFGLGGRFGSGRQWWSWISLDDAVAALLWLLDTDISGPVNVVSPNPVSNAEYTRILGRVLRRPTLVPTPKPAVWVKLGRELTEALVYASTRVEPAALTAGGFEFSHPDLEPALRHLLDRP